MVEEERRPRPMLSSSDGFTFWGLFFFQENNDSHTISPDLMTRMCLKPSLVFAARVFTQFCVDSLLRDVEKLLLGTGLFFFLKFCLIIYYCEALCAYVLMWFCCPRQHSAWFTKFVKASLWFWGRQGDAVWEPECEKICSVFGDILIKSANHNR